MNLAQSTLLNVMKIPHFGQHQEVNACVKLLLSCYHGNYLWLYHRITVDPTLFHRIIGLSMQGPDPQGFLSRKSRRSRASTEDQGYLWQCREGNKRLQCSFYLEWHSVPRMSTDSWKVSKEEPTYAGHRLRR
jgi:hypothetical protein